MKLILSRRDLIKKSAYAAVLSGLPGHLAFAEKVVNRLVFSSSKVNGSALLSILSFYNDKTYTFKINNELHSFLKSKNLVFGLPKFDRTLVIFDLNNNKLSQIETRKFHKFSGHGVANGDFLHTIEINSKNNKSYAVTRNLRNKKISEIKDLNIKFAHDIKSINNKFYISCKKENAGIFIYDKDFSFETQVSFQDSNIVPGGLVRNNDELIVLPAKKDLHKEKIVLTPHYLKKGKLRSYKSSKNLKGSELLSGSVVSRKIFTTDTKNNRILIWDTKKKKLRNSLSFPTPSGLEFFNGKIFVNSKEQAQQAFINPSSEKFVKKFNYRAINSSHILTHTTDIWIQVATIKLAVAKLL